MRAKLLFPIVMLGALISGAFAVSADDPYAWLEDIHGAKPLAWVAEQNKKSLGQLKADPRYQKNYDNILQVLDATDRIPFGSIGHGFVYNFWQDAKNPKGLWRRTSIADYRQPVPHWELLLDVDALASAEKQNWVFAGAECSPNETRCLIRLSRGGGDAVVIREYDLKAKKLASDGFALPEAKADATYLNDDTVLFSTAADGATSSGYANSVKQWQRGTPIAAAKKIYEGDKSDVGSSAVSFHTKEGNFAVITRSVSFFETDYFAVENGAAKKLSMPRSADLKGMIHGALIASLRDDYSGFKKGALLAFREGAKPQLVYQPGPRGSIESVATGRDKLYAAITDNVVGAVHVFTSDGKNWTNKAWRCRAAVQPTSSPPAISAPKRCSALKII
jgi:prolyl oligopeptidase